MQAEGAHYNLIAIVLMENGAQLMAADDNLGFEACLDELMSA
jgi:hypothetical protein